MIKDGIVLVGSEGHIGKCVQYGLTKLGCEFKTHDLAISPVPMFPESYPPSYKDMIRDAKLVLSCMPYYENLNLAKNCVELDIPYADLGGSVPVSKAIAGLGGKTFTDLGLAPGWANIIAEQLIHHHHRIPAEVEMMVGGLPLHRDDWGPLEYCFTWSKAGLINEYLDDCLILREGEIETVEGMSGLRGVWSEHLGDLEAFYTSGGAAHSCKEMEDLGVINCSYSTIRYPGHRDLMKWLLDRLPHKLVAGMIDSPDEPCDIVIVKVRVDERCVEILVEHGGKFSAMQRATAFPFLSAALHMDGMVDGVKLGYRHIPFEDFNKTLEELGLRPNA
jgi:hypothetical protein